MKKYLLWTGLAGFGFLMAHASYALSSEEQVKATKDAFIKEFQKMDTDKDGVISEQEYLSYQFEAFRANIIEAEGFNAPQGEEVVEKTVVTEVKVDKPQVELGGISPALKEMAEFEVDFGELPEVDENALPIVEEKTTTVVLTKEDVMPEEKIIAQETDTIQGLLADMQQTVEEEKKAEEKWENLKEEDQMELMMNSIRKTLPKKIDDITSWVDISYDNKLISYIYEADVDTKEFSDEEKKMIEDSIKNEACVAAYKDMCPKVKPMFIDQGIEMKIRYLDKNKQEISFCEFNKETCQ